jgi:hypothetical protein
LAGSLPFFCGRETPECPVPLHPADTKACLGACPAAAVEPSSTHDRYRRRRQSVQRPEPSLDGEDKDGVSLRLARGGFGK